MILIAYFSKTGITREAAEILADLLPSSKLVDLAQNTPSLEDYDSVIIGSGIRVGTINKAIIEFLDKNKAALSSKKYGIFISNCFADSTDTILATIPEAIRNGAAWMGSVGGQIDVSRLKGLDKMVAKAMTKSLKEGQKISEELDRAALEELASCFR